MSLYFILSRMFLLLDRLRLKDEPVPQTDFSHRLFRHNLDNLLCLLNKFTVELLIKFRQFLINSPTSTDSARIVVEFALKSSHNLALCLSLLDLLQVAINCFVSLKNSQDTPQLIAEAVSSKFEEKIALSRLASFKITGNKIKASFKCHCIQSTQFKVFFADASL